MIKESLSIGGEIESITIRGTEAFVVFVNKESAENCLLLVNTQQGGSPISIEQLKELHVRLSEDKNGKQIIPHDKKFQADSQCQRKRRYDQGISFDRWSDRVN